MCDEIALASQFKRNGGEELAVNLKRDIEAFFAQKYGTSSCAFQVLLPQGDNMAKVDFTISRDEGFTRRYVGSAGYVENHLSLGEVIRLW